MPVGVTLAADAPARARLALTEALTEVRVDDVAPQLQAA
jgi:hypothetical protein